MLVQAHAPGDAVHDDAERARGHSFLPTTLLALATRPIAASNQLVTTASRWR
jgi:hypothetical protein